MKVIKSSAIPVGQNFFAVFAAIFLGNVFIRELFGITETDRDGAFGPKLDACF
jgi:hypothetical protein